MSCYSTLCTSPVLQLVGLIIIFLKKKTYKNVMNLSETLLRAKQNGHAFIAGIKQGTGHKHSHMCF